MPVQPAVPTLNGVRKLRPDLIPDDIYAACEQIRVERQIGPGDIRGNTVWERLGRRESKTTTQKYVRRWQEMQPNDDVQEDMTTAQGMKEMADLLNRLVASAISDEREQARVRENALKAEASRLRDALARAHMDSEDKEKRLEDIRADLEKEALMLEQQSLSIADLEKQVVILQSQVSARDELLAMLTTGEAFAAKDPYGRMVTIFRPTRPSDDTIVLPSSEN